MEWLWSRPVVIGLALTGAALSVAAMALRKRQGAAPWAAHWAARVDAVSYVFMGVSMLLFIIAGLRGPQN